VQVIELDGVVPASWQGFAQRWRGWRQRFDRSAWERSWQGHAWRDGLLRFPSPWSAGELSTQLSVRQGLVFGYVLQEQRQRALLLPGWLGGGHELEALYLLREQVLLLLPGSLATSRWFVLALAELLPLLVAATPWPAVLDPQRPRQLILEGHPNFAHQLLNVLTALEGIGGQMQPLQWLGPEPYGPVRELYPQSGWQGHPLAQPLGTIFELPLSQRPERIPAAMRQRLRRFCAAQLGAEAEQLLERLLTWRAGGGQVLWVSLKTQGALAEGLPLLVSAWMEELHRRGRSLPLLLLDGFSLQWGDGPDTPIYGTTVGVVLDEERLQAAELRRGLAALEMPVVEAIGLSLAESIALGGGCRWLPLPSGHGPAQAGLVPGARAWGGAFLQLAQPRRPPSLGRPGGGRAALAAGGLHAGPGGGPPGGLPLPTRAAVGGCPLAGRSLALAA
jgi:hypothetical protein